MMKGTQYMRKLLAWALCLVMLVSLAAPVLAVEEDAPPAGVAVEAQTPAEKAEVPAEKAETPAEKAEVPVEKAETPAEKAEAPAEKAETPIEKVEIPAEKDEAPVEKMETPTEKGEVPAEKAEAPAVGEDGPVAASETPAVASQAPVKTTQAPAEALPPVASQPTVESSAAPAPAASEGPFPAPTANTATLFSSRPASGSFVIDWDSQDLQDSGWDSTHGVVRADGGYYLYFETGEWGSASLNVYTPDAPYRAAMSFTTSASERDHLRDAMNGNALWNDEGVDVRYYTENGRRYTEAYIPAELLPEGSFTLSCNTASFRFSAARAGEEEDPGSDEFALDWTQVEFQATNQWDSSNANTVAIVQGDGGYYFCFCTTNIWSGGSDVGIFYDAEPGTLADRISFYAWNPDVATGLNGTVHTDAIVKSQVQGDLRYTEVYLPGEHFDSYDFTLMLGEGIFLESKDIPLKLGQTASDLPTLPGQAEAVYTGISIDGDFHDWDAVPKLQVDDFHGGLAVDEFALVWDGDYIYIYLAENGERQPYGNVTGNWTSVTGAGPNSNGQFAITTDLGRTLLIQPVVRNNEPAVAGVDGAMAAVNNKAFENAPHRWELAIPTSALPEYLETFSFGLYLVEPFIRDVSNMQDTPGAVAPFQANVVIDGKYNDWIGYPHSLIEYDNPGIQHHKVDGEAALWSSDGMLYGHVVTEHPDHLAEQGSEFLAAISIAFNGDRDYKHDPKDGNFYPRILAIDANGSITDYYTTLNEGNPLSPGTHTFYIFDIRTDPIHQFGHEDESGVWHDATAADLIENAFGTMKVTVTGVKDEMEFDLDLEKVAAYIGQDPSTAFKTIDAQFGRIGPQWITTAGTPTGPILGVALAVGAIGAPMCYAEIKKRRGARKDKADGQAS